MSDSSRTADDARAAFQSCKSRDPKDQVQFYDSWAENYEEDHTLMSYRAPDLAVNFLSDHFSGNPEDALVLDVACGSGWVARVMVKLGFRLFVGVDGSKGMLEQAAQTGLYQDLKLALLGPEPLPAPPDTFDVVIMVGALDDGFAPVSVVRELCHAAKPGGLVCMARGDHRATSSHRYKKDLERELQLMEEDGLWSPVRVQHVHRYMQDPHEEEERYITGNVYLYRKSSRAAVHS
ncbi:Methyltransferase-like protein 27 [Collichthys lucidus]|uniref:Methyltransferase-like protein 27 n=1 Tax=Collichthys lucidus TaxID=240159 RepID=A0A4U5V800_COLLU|nr:Methyltransferase-like protein 27 [Collichthys lucidus]TKS82769.1 Methyltransferase-like protein 27 [Collichthys lucidus]